MFVTSLSALAASVRSTLSRGRANTATHSHADARRVPGGVADSVTISTLAITRMKGLDADGDEDVRKDELTERAVQMLRRASVRRHHQRIGSAS
jgi:hypothetical protein